MVIFLERNNLAKIRKDVEDCIGKKVILKANKGRKRTVTKEGVLENAYPSLFIVKVQNEFDSVRRVSFTYSDILTETVELTICDSMEKLPKIS